MKRKQTQVQPARKLQHCMLGIFIRDYFHNNVIVCDKTIANVDSVLGKLTEGAILLEKE